MMILGNEIGRLEAYGANAPTTAHIPIWDSATKQATYVTPDQIASGASAVDGPSSATDNAVALFDSTTGKLIKNSTLISSAGALAVPGAITSATEQTDYQEFVGISSIITTSTGTWTPTRIAQGNYVLRKTAADDTTIIGIDVTPVIRTTASKGFKLNSIDFIYSIATDVLEGHTATLDLITYANAAAVTVTSVPLTLTLGTATNANPYVTNGTVTTPAYDITADTKYVIEQTVNAAATTAFDWYGVNLRFARNNL